MMASVTAEKPFNPTREIFIRWVDGLYTALRNSCVALYFYFQILVGPNLIFLLALFLIFAPLLLVIGASTPAALYLSDHHEQIFSDIAGAGNTIEAGFKDAESAINHVLTLLKPGFRIYNLFVNAIFFVGIRFWELFGCQVGSTDPCPGFEQAWTWLGNIMPFTVQLFYDAWSNLHDAFAPLTALSIPVPPSNVVIMGALLLNASSTNNNNTFTMNGTELLYANGMSNVPLYYANGTLVNDLADGLPDHIQHRMVYLKDMPAEWRTRITRSIIELQQVPRVLSDRDTLYTRADMPPNVPGTCTLCTVMLDFVHLATDPDVLYAILDFFNFLLNFGVTILIQWAKDLINFFIPFLEWLKAFVGGDLIGFFADLISKVEALFAWVNDVWSVFEDVWESVTDSIMGSLGSLVDSIDTLFQASYNLLFQSFQQFASVLGGIILALEQNILAQIQAIKNQIDAIFQNICDICDSISTGTGATNAGTNALNAGTNALSGVSSLNLKRSEDNPVQSSRAIGGGSTNSTLMKELDSRIGVDGNSNNNNNGGSAHHMNARISCPGCKRRKRSTDTKDTESEAGSKRARSDSGALAYVYPLSWPQPVVMQYKIFSMRDAAQGNLTITPNSLCWRILRTGFDTYEYSQLPFAQRLLWIGCFTAWEYGYYYTQIQQQQQYFIENNLPLPSPLSWHNTETQAAYEEAKRTIRSMNDTLSGARRSIRRMITETSERSRRVLEQRKRERSDLTSSSFSSWFSGQWLNAPNFTANVDDLRASYAGNYKVPISSLLFSEQTIENMKTVVPAHRIEKLRRSFQQVSETPKFQKLAESWKRFTEDTLNRVDVIRVRHPRVDIPNTPEWHAFRIHEEAKAEWNRLGRFLSRGPTAVQIRDYLRTNGTKLRNFMEVHRVSREQARGGHSFDGYETFPSSSNGGRFSRALGGKDFWNFFTNDIWQWVGDRVYNAVVFYTECNPLPTPYGPGGDPNPNFNSPHGRWCLPYVNPDMQLDISMISIDVIFPSCCKPPHHCVGYSSPLNEVRYIARVFTNQWSIDWHKYIGWVPFAGTPLSNWLTFPTNKPPSDGWYCFSVNFGYLLVLAFWTIIAFILVLGCLPLETICYWCISKTLCVTCLCTMRLLLSPCGLCRPRYHKIPRYQKDLILLQEVLPFIPGLGTLGVVLRASAIAGSSGGTSGGAGGGGISPSTFLSLVSSRKPLDYEWDEEIGTTPSNVDDTLSQDVIDQAQRQLNKIAQKHAPALLRRVQRRLNTHVSNLRQTTSPSVATASYSTREEQSAHAPPSSSTLLSPASSSVSTSLSSSSSLSPSTAATSITTTTTTTTAATLQATGAVAHLVPVANPLVDDIFASPSAFPSTTDDQRKLK